MGNERGVRAEIRRKWEDKATAECAEISRKLSDDSFRARKGRASKEEGPGCFASAVGAAVGFFAPSMIGLHPGICIVGLIVGAIAGGFLYDSGVDSTNDGIEKNVKRLESEAEQKRIAARDRCSREADCEIAAYDARVAKCIEKAKANSSYLGRMADFLVQEFDKQLQARQWIAGNADRDVVVDFGFEVTRTELRIFDGENWHSNVYTFHRERYTALNSSEECEAMAQVLSKVFAAKLKPKYKSQHATLKITDQLDGMVKRRFTMPNKNFVSGTNIF